MNGPEHRKPSSLEANRARLRRQGMSGLEASSLGFVLVGCIGFGYALGAGLDGHFQTTHWTPIMVLVGVAAGFREMFRTVSRLSHKSVTDTDRTGSSDNFSGGDSVVDTAQSEQSGEPATIVEDVERRRPRIFEVPPPPRSSFAGGTGPSDPPRDASAAQQPDSDLIEKLLTDDKPRRNE